MVQVNLTLHESPAPNCPNMSIQQRGESHNVFMTSLEKTVETNGIPYWHTTAVRSTTLYVTRGRNLSVDSMGVAIHSAETSSPHQVINMTVASWGSDIISCTPVLKLWSQRNKETANRDLELWIPFPKARTLTSFMHFGKGLVLRKAVSSLASKQRDFLLP